MKHFLNREMLAPNVMTIAVDPGIVQEFADPAALQGNFSKISPKWSSDVQWVSAADEAAFETFQSAFDRLGIAAHVEPYVDVQDAVRLYAGFLVVRSRCTEANFHCDWRGANNDAFTLLTPATANAGGFGLLYERLSGDVGDYDYSMGEAIVFGDGFSHSTQPGDSADPVVLLCFEFGSDRMEHWPKIYPNIAKQATHLRQPDGKFVATGKQSL
jgi:hypothetical protein